MNDYFHDSYDVIVIGAALATLTSALDLAQKGLKVLVLEANDMPGGVATSYMRHGAEIEASLHEMLSIGDKKNPLHVRKFLESHGVEVDWVRIPDSYRYVSPRLDVTVHAGSEGDYSMPAKDIASVCPNPEESEKKILAFFDLCDQVYRSGTYLIDHKVSSVRMFREHRGYVVTAGYNVMEVMDAFSLPKQAKEVLSAYWLYLGSPILDMPFSIYGYILAGYIGYGSYVPRHTSYEMSALLAKAALNAGVRIEYGQKVEKILVHNGKVIGVRLASKEEIKAPYVVSGAYPNAVFGAMVEPSEEVPEKAKKWVNAMELGVSVFSLILLLDKEAKELGVDDYCVFHNSLGETTKEAFEKGRKDADWDYLTVLCPNIVLPEASPKGTCLLNIVYLPSPEAFDEVSPEGYEEYKARHAKHFIEVESKRLGVNLFDHIVDIFYETPLSVSHYVHAYKGGVYGYRHTMADSVVARVLDREKEHFIEGLAFSGAHGASGDGMAPAFDNGLDASRYILSLASKGGKR